MIRKASLAAALWMTTALTPTPADAAAVAAFTAGFTGATAAGAAAVSGTFASAAFSAGAFLGTTAVGQIVVSVGLSAISAALTPRPRTPKPSEIMGNFAQPLSHFEYVYGRTRKGGVVGFTGAANDRRYYVPIIASHSIKGIHQHWIDEYVVGVSTASTPFDQGNFLTVDDDDTLYTAPRAVDGKGRIEVFTGQDGQTANTGLVSKFSQLSSSHDFAGLAGAVVWAKKAGNNFSEVYPNGRQWAWTPVVDGNDQIYDPRDGTRKWTSNAALCIAHWLTEIHGQEVDWNEVATEADVCDDVVQTREGNSVPRWQINGRIDDGQSFEEQRPQMAGACDAFLYERPDGKVGFKVGRWIEPTVILTAADFYSLEITEGQWGPDAPTEIAPIYVEPENNWRETSGGVYQFEDDGRRRVRDEPNLLMVTEHNQVSRVAARIIRAKRARYTLRGTLGLIGYHLIGNRFFKVEHEGLGISQTFEIGALRREGGAVFEVEANSAGVADFEFDAAFDEPPRPKIRKLNDGFVVPEPTGVTALSQAGGSIRVSWDAQGEAYSQEVRWRVTGSPEFESVVASAGSGSYTITGLIDGATYDVQVRNVSAVTSGTPSDYAPETPLQVQAIVNPTPPAAVASPSVSASLDTITVQWTAPNDLNYSGVRIWRSTTNDFATGALVRTDYGPLSEVDSWNDDGLAAGTYYYWLAPINSSGVEGGLQGSFSDTVV